MCKSKPVAKGTRAFGWPIGAVAERTGLAPSAIRYYESEGLVRPWRDDAGQRRYDRTDIRRLSFIMIAQSLGASLAEIRDQLAALPKGRAPTAADWRQMSEHYRAALDARIATLTRLRDNLGNCIGCGCLSLDSCALYNAGDRAGRKGPGPRYLMGDPIPARGDRSTE
ncbi:redox-sensitive transcriptional activator SoxR [Pseudooceanicola sp. CBS1P-1]|uniref:Redox-sensitive transcriptional activator SoxR n=1 Tax=Pseudooceanicola albus TaxID=2692189 RepID=A0A6L7G5U5_9RHOB|nr:MULTISPECIES: redox-sensitive transcriptional activator SoxR [Pseudooceanicola]MBT9386162.1 redox-sensitive transcriptional activator SoxR [Pseudooceanicola endophyticus]MXN19421.1 redox-sensitive transcriptional activator SoxR [Pseudooceanicola albus]